MTILLEQHLPVPRQMIEAVAAEMNVHEDPPAGLLLHVACEEPGGVRIVDVWNSQAEWEAFEAGRLGPAIAKVAAAHGMEPEAGAPSVSTEVFEVVKGA